MLFSSMSLFIASCLICSLNATNGEDSGIQICSKNLWYWEYKGKPVLLIGGTDDDNVFNWPYKKMIQQMDLLASVGGNYDRCTMSSRLDKGIEIKPYLKLDNGKYDLNQPNPEFWERFENYLTATEERGIIVQVEVWATYDMLQADYPFNPAANINYGAYPETTLRVSDSKALKIQIHGAQDVDFYHTIPDLSNDKVVLPYQQAYVDKILSISLKYDNVLYTIDNEYSAYQPYQWGHYWANYIRNKANKLGKKVCITEMNIYDWNLGRPLKQNNPLSDDARERLGDGQSYMFNRNHRAVFDHPEIYDFADISDNADQHTTEHAKNMRDVRNYLESNPRPINHDKIYGADFGIKATTKEGINMFWRNILGGAASCRFHRPPTGLGLSEIAQANIRAINKFLQHVKPWECEPAPHLLKNCEENEAYLIANPGKAYGLYFTDFGGDGWVKINFQNYREKFQLRWINVQTGEWHGEPISFASGGSEGNVIQMPFSGSNYGWAAVIVSLNQQGNPYR